MSKQKRNRPRWTPSYEEYEESLNAGYATENYSEVLDIMKEMEDGKTGRLRCRQQMISVMKYKQLKTTFLSVILNGEISLVCKPKGKNAFRVHFLCRKQCHFACFIGYTNSISPFGLEVQKTFC